MSGKKISEMTAITGAQLDQTNDVLPVLDVSDTSNPNKKISIQELASVIGASGTTNVSLALDGSNNLTLTDSDSNTVTVDLSSLDNSTLTLADVTANNAVTGDVVTITEARISTPQTNRAAFHNKNVFSINDVAIYQLNTGATTVNSKSGQNLNLSINNSFVGRVSANGIGIFKTPSVTLDIQGTDAVQLTSGTTAQRPDALTVANGMIRYNSDDDVFEGYAGDTGIGDGAWGEVAQFRSNALQPQNSSYSGSGGVYFNNSYTELRSGTGTGGRLFVYSSTLQYTQAGVTVLDVRSSATKINSLLTVGSTSTPSVTLDIQGTDAVQLTSGTTAQRPDALTVANGMIRYNSDDDVFEGYDGDWGSIVKRSSAFGGTNNQIEFGGGVRLVFDSGRATFQGTTTDLKTFKVRATDETILSQKVSIHADGSQAAPSVTLDIQGTDAVQLTSGTEAQRPTAPANGMIRYNSDDDVFEGYDGDWRPVVTLTDYSTGTNNALKVTPVSGFVDIGSTVDFRGIDGVVSNLRLRPSSNVQVWTKMSVNTGSTPSVTLDIQGTDAVQLTAGTTGERPTAAAGMIRFNTTTSKFEGYDGTSWIDLN